MGRVRDTISNRVTKEFRSSKNTQKCKGGEHKIVFRDINGQKYFEISNGQKKSTSKVCRGIIMILITFEEVFEEWVLQA